MDKRFVSRFRAFIQALLRYRFLVRNPESWCYCYSKFVMEGIIFDNVAGTSGAKRSWRFRKSPSGERSVRRLSFHRFRPLPAGEGRSQKLPLREIRRLCPFHHV